MRRQVGPVSAAILTFAVLALLAAPASALAVKTTSKALPFASGPISIQFGPAVQAGSQAAIVGIILDASVKLPVAVRLPIPQGASIGWAGEVLGGDPSADPEAKYNVETGAGGGRYAIFELKQSHIGQIDTYAAPPAQNGADVSAAMSFVQSVPATQTTISVRLPAGISNVQLKPAALVAPVTNASGETLYTVLQRQLATGERVDVTAGYRLGVPSRSAATSPVLIALVIALLAVVVALVFVLQHGGGGGGEGNEADPDEGRSDDDGFTTDAEADQDQSDAGDAEPDPGDAEQGLASRASGDEPVGDDPFDSIDFE